ncbi:class I SAM-dependent methyltransferase [Chlorogloeopsis sp. ULAP01]|uniref:class I SAM-dependent methyltransferase n=1 Tax=Chlorogloeopsis sp. ULAP01 TaxID=3056483 RepID=UPI0025AA7DA9|nr:class I SAM-dependent methyltransferase [Chlorogloeopsis sp. ULAP01]MDM9380122.1 class I SAM-dependent methyltransferase [Chlorogloeopsis sp. ULAP01]
MTQEFFRHKKQLFDRWAPSYDWLFPSVFYQAIHKRLLEYVNLPPQANVLDLGCGTGRLLTRLADHFPDLHGTGLDLSSQMLRVARHSNRHHPRLIYIEGKAKSLPFADGQFDAVFNTISFLHYPEPKQVFAEVARVLKEGGCFYLVDFSYSSQTEPFSKLMNAGGIRFYNKNNRELLGSSCGLKCVAHHYLLGPVLLTIFTKSV